MLVRNRTGEQNSWDIIVEFIFSKGYNIDLKNVHGATALHEASLRGNIFAVNSIMPRKPKVDETNNSGETALHFTARAGHLNICKILLENGWNKNIRGKHGL